MVVAAFRFLLAAVGGTVAVIVFMCAISGRWPSMVVVGNRMPDAVTCSVAFSDGFTWDIELAPKQERFWLFILGRPEKAAITCDAAGAKLERLHYFCTQDFEQTITLTPDKKPTLCLDR